MSVTKLFSAMLIGSVIGGMVSLLDKETRKSSIEVSRKMKDVISHPSMIPLAVSAKTKQLRNTVEDITNDVSFVMEKVEELQEITPKIASIVRETKEVFTKPNPVHAIKQLDEPTPYLP